MGSIFCFVLLYLFLEKINDTGKYERKIEVSLKTTYFPLALDEYSLLICGIKNIMCDEKKFLFC